MEEKKDHKIIEECRVCRSSDLVPYLNLGDMPLVNNLLTPEEIPLEKKYPLEVLLCKDCNLSQLSVVVDPEVLFRHYVYRSSISDSFKDHCSKLAEKLNANVLKPGDLMLDIASNDGCLLRPFKERGNRVLGVDPALNLAQLANQSGIETIPEFWDPSLAKKILKDYGPAKVITACNVFAHVDDVHSFVKGVRTLLADDGEFIIEAPYLHHLIEKTEFDTVYHEHLSYLLVKPIERLARQHDFRLARVEKLDIHGGSMRYFLEKRNRKDTIDGSVQRVMEEEESAGLYHPGAYRGVQRQVDMLKNNMVSVFGELKALGKRIVAFGASAKGNILNNYCGFGPETIERIYDDTPEKQGKHSPGGHVLIVPRGTKENPNQFLLKDNPEYMLLNSWNFAQEMMGKTQDYKAQGGKFIKPVPFLEII